MKQNIPNTEQLAIKNPEMDNYYYKPEENMYFDFWGELSL